MDNNLFDAHLKEVNALIDNDPKFLRTLDNTIEVDIEAAQEAVICDVCKHPVHAHCNQGDCENGGCEVDGEDYAPEE